MVGAHKGLEVHVTTDLHAATSHLRSSAHTSMQVTNNNPILQVVGGASLLRICWGLSEELNVDVYL